MVLKKFFLLAISITITVIALIYGVSPQWFAQTFLNMSDLSIDFAHVLRAVMGLYVAFALFWSFAAFNSEYRNIGLLTAMILGGGLLIGRVLAMLTDGLPSTIFIIYALLEISLLPVAYWIYKQPA